MADSITADMDASALIAAINDLGPFAQPYINKAAAATGAEIVAEAETRLSRQLGPAQKPTPKRPDLGKGLTLAGLSSQQASDGNGVIVSDARDPFPNVPLWEERGTYRREPAHPFFDVSVQLSQGSHEERIANALQEAIDAKGLGE